jgi:hypothetical protein
MTMIDRALAEAAVDCPRCRRLVAAGAASLTFLPPCRVDLGAAASYAPSRIFGCHDAPGMRCPDCGRQVRVEDQRSCVWVWMDLDRDPRTSQPGH